MARRFSFITDLVWHRGGSDEGRLSPIAAYAFAVGAVALCALFRWSLVPVLEGQGVYLAFMIPVAASAYLGGTGPGALSIALSSLAASPVFRPPFDANQAVAAHLAMFVFEALAVLLLMRRLQQRTTDMRRALADAEVARGQAEAANRAKEQFVARLSHEWRSPINTLAGWIWQLESRADDVALVRRAAASMKRAVDTQSPQVSDLLDYSRGTRGKLSMTPERVEMVPIVRRAIESVADEAARKALRVRIEDETAGGRVWADPLRLEQVFVNLLHNAVKFTPASGQIRVVLLPHDDAIEVAVHDTGAGIQADALATIFEAFAQSDERRDTQQGGLGLGLSIVRQIVELHGGTVWAVSDGPGRGSAFCVRLPSAASQAPPAAAGGPARRPATSVIVAQNPATAGQQPAG